MQLSIVGTGAGGHTLGVPMVGPVQPPRILTSASTTFTVGVAGSFLVSSIGGPLPSVTETGALPTGVTFVDNGDGSARLAGTPSAGTGGIYHLDITASNGQPPDATESFTLTVDQAPSITSAAAAPFDVGIPGSFLVTTAGFPTSTLTETGALPTGVTFVDNGDGSARLAGTPSAGTGGTYYLNISAVNGVGAGASQAFTLTINPASLSPAITSAASATFRVGEAGSFLVVATGTSKITEAGALPPGVSFVDNGNGTATLSGTAARNAVGIYHLTITAAGGVGPAITEAFTLDVVAGAPRALRLQRLGVSQRLTRIVLSFDQAMDPARAEDTNNYVFRPLVRGHVLNRPRQLIHVASAIYDPASRTVSLRPAKQLSLHRLYQITVAGTPPYGLTDASGVPIDGQGDGRTGSDLVLTFGRRASLRGMPGPGLS